mmetsp:Transcript_4982/g.15170  ORF Transcript_4982/g.15170 Transcript_4982/m.15170 type:complete len:264 (-) Transcript_4982:304-1095(-)
MTASVQFTKPNICPPLAHRSVACKSNSPAGAVVPHRWSLERCNVVCAIANLRCGPAVEDHVDGALRWRRGGGDCDERGGDAADKLLQQPERQVLVLPRLLRRLAIVFVVLLWCSSDVCRVDEQHNLVLGGIRGERVGECLPVKAEVVCTAVSSHQSGWLDDGPQVLSKGGRAAPASSVEHDRLRVGRAHHRENVGGVGVGGRGEEPRIAKEHTACLPALSVEPRDGLLCRADLLERRAGANEEFTASPGFDASGRAIDVLGTS